MSDDVLVRFRVPGDTAHCQAPGLALKHHERVVVDAEGGQRIGTVIDAETTPGTEPPRPVLRRINEDDIRVGEHHRIREREAFQFCAERIKALQVPMKLISVEIAHSGTRATFYFTSPDRVDFRVLVKDLAGRFHTRIEMRQVGVRDAARHTGGTGICGRELCCSTWLPEFKPISMRMAKDQNLSLNQDKLSGLCGRLRCCLSYEQGLYQEQRSGLPKLGKAVLTPDGPGTVRDLDVLRRRVRVQLADGGTATFDAADLKRPDPSSSDNT